MLIYLIKLSVSLSLVWLFYQLVLRRLTFYNSNRWYLLLYTAVSFLIPFIDISVLLQKNDLSGARMVELIPSVENYAGFTPQQQAPALATQQPVMPWWIAVFLAGALIVLSRLLLQVFSMYRLRKRASLVSNEEVKLYEVNEAIAPFSFGNAIFVNRQLHNNEELEKIIRHEFVHVRQRHSLDVLWGEVLCMLNWYNPFAWLIRRSIRQNLEFIADNQVVGSGVDKKQYQYLLLKVTGGAQFRIASQFNFTSLKKRIIMMNKVRTAKVHLLRFVFVLPLAAVLLLAFRSGIGQNASQSAYLQAAVINDTTKPMDFDEFMKRNPSVNGVGWMSEPHRMIVKLKNGGEERYNLENAADREKLVQKYGGIPASPPPPPPAPAAPGRGHISISTATPGLSPAHKAFFTHNPSVTRVEWADGRQMTVHSASGIETYDLNEKNEVAKAEKKYGRLPALPIHNDEDPGAPPAPQPAEPAVAVAEPPAPAWPARPGEAAAPIPPLHQEGLLLSADEIIISDNGHIKLKGDVKVDNESLDAVEIKHASLSWESESILIVDGRPAERNKKYTGRFKVKKLPEEEAVRKYGEQGRKGVVELVRMQE